MDEEPYNLATYLALRTAARLGTRATFFTWQNLYRRYPPPFGAMEQACYAQAPVAIAGSQDAADVLRRKGYRRDIAVIPQVGVDPQQFAPISLPAPSDASARAAPYAVSAAGLQIGYAGGLLREKGVDLLLRACASLPGPWRLLLAGEGQERAALERLGGELRISPRVTFLGRQSSGNMPAFYQALDVLVLPSRTLPNWKEQFGRVLVEAMACAVPVIGSDSGEIPHVIGDGGLIFAEDDADALRCLLHRLANDADERARLGAAGRRRVLAHYTMQSIAAKTLTVYEQLATLDAHP
jgi:glycosyltransferase involved in cell wall biosynthesis